jgi:hypothetical protein
MPVAEVPLWVVGILVTVVGALGSLAILIATSFIRSSYVRVDETLKRVEATMASLSTHRTIHEEWRKFVDVELKSHRRRLGALEHKVFGHARADDTPTKEE